jgi:hypothetical protein
MVAQLNMPKGFTWSIPKERKEEPGEAPSNGGEVLLPISSAADPITKSIAQKRKKWDSRRDFLLLFRLPHIPHYLLGSFRRKVLFFIYRTTY